MIKTTDTDNVNSGPESSPNSENSEGSTHTNKCRPQDTEGEVKQHVHRHKPTESELLEIAQRWHVRIYDELASPILPEDLDEETKNKKLNEISRQREKHKMYCRVLEKLIRTNKSKTES
jgi:hypothetical protein